jgi:hypothetical protein
MKRSFEEEIKNRLKDIEMPYDSSAWRNVSSSLDQNVKNTSSSRFKWLLTGVLLTSIIGFGIFSTSKENVSIVSENKTPETKIKNEVNESNQPITNLKEVDQTDLKQVADASTSPNQNKRLNKELEVTNELKVTESLKADTKTAEPKVIDENTIINKNQLNVNKLIPIQVADLCLGEKTEIKNLNDYSLYIIQPNRDRVELKNEEITYTPNEVGLYKIVSMKNEEFTEVSNFRVHAIEKINFEMDEENNYQAGLPYKLFTTNSISSNIEWYLNNKLITKNTNRLELTLFKKGIYSVQLVSKNDLCSSTSEKQFVIENDYNLLAVDAFNPSETNYKTNSFIPYALEERNVKFTFIVIDPKDGNVIYQTNDKLKPWNGIDQRSGQLVPKNSNWIWKVTIEQPEKGENPNYKGIVVRI